MNSNNSATQQFIHSSFSGPIPGESLTSEPGGRPWEKPAQFTKLPEAMNYIMNQLTEPVHMKQLLSLMDAGMPIENITRVTLFTGFTLGKWNPDLGMLLYKPLMVSLIAIAKRAGLEDTPITMPSSLDDHINEQTQQHMMMQSFKGEPIAPVHMPDNTLEETEEEPASNGFMTRSA